MVNVLSSASDICVNYDRQKIHEIRRSQYNVLSEMNTVRHTLVSSYGELL
jgi:hypothetical protein